MTSHSLPGLPPVPLCLRRSGRARRISLRVSQLDGRVTLTLPKGVSESEAIAFARSKEAWIRGHLDARPETLAVGIGTEIPVEGVPHRVVATQGRRILLGDGQLGVPQDAAARRIEAWLRELARDRLVAASDAYAAQIGRRYGRITLRDTRSRWGSCSSGGGLMYSWRLILAPPEVLRYVAAHEVAHLAEMNHSPAFWSVVNRIYGPHQAARGWLRQNGSALHRFSFDG